MGKSYAEIAEERRQSILDRTQLVPSGKCHFCGYAVPKLAHWCSSECARDFDKEKAELLGA